MTPKLTSSQSSDTWEMYLARRTLQRERSADDDTIRLGRGSFLGDPCGYSAIIRTFKLKEAQWMRRRHKLINVDALRAGAGKGKVTESSLIPLGGTEPIDTGISGFQSDKTMSLCYSKMHHLKIIVKAVLRSRRVRKASNKEIRSSTM
jgi:hypothetical protein